MFRLNRHTLRRWLSCFVVTLLLVTQLGTRPSHAIDVMAMLGDLLTELEARTGYTLTHDVSISNTTVDQERFIGRDRVYARTVQVVERGDDYIDAVEASGGVGMTTTWDLCLIVLGDRVPALESDLRSLLAHELAHCYQYDRMGDLRALPDWLREGSAEWMGQTLSTSTNLARPRWSRYLGTSASLYRRSYDAMGFFAHLAYQGVDVWNLLDRYFSSPDLPLLSDQMFDHLLTMAGSRDLILQTWSMSLERNGSAGRDWDTNGPAITSDRRSAAALPVPGTQTVDITTQYLWDLTLPAGQIVTVNVSNGYGAIRWNRETETFSGSFSKRYCLGDTCQCEDGSSPPGVESVSTASALLAVTADNTPGSITVEVEDPPCEEDPETSSGTTGGGERATGSSFGDPHIITYDGYRYSFQTVGEFLLSKSFDGHFEVQARQSQVPDRSLSLNTAVAMRAGDHRIAIYAQDAPYGQNGLWVDGAPVLLGRESLTLSGGVRITSQGLLSYQVSWPTGEVVALSEIEAGGLPFINISPSVPRRGAGPFMGLLGDLNGQPNDDVKTRDGQVIPSQDVYAPVTQLIDRVIDIPLPLNSLQNAYFEQLYRQFGDSWRISEDDSLFDYGPGQTTESFTNRAFPEQFPSLFGVGSDRIQLATRTCQGLDIDPTFMAGCVFDVAATGQPSFAQAALQAVTQWAVDEVAERVEDRIEDEIEEVIPFPVRIPGLPF